MYADLFVASTIICLGNIFFEEFEEKTPKWVKIIKWALYIGITAVVSSSLNRFWVYVWILGVPVLGFTAHYLWCSKNGINIFTAEPKDKYYELRGWDKK